MSKLIYSAIMSLDGYIEDANGAFDWAEPDPEVHAFANSIERDVGTYLFGRRMYETMSAWETDDALLEGSPVLREFAETWRAADKIVYSTTLERPITKRTRIERRFDPEAVRALKESSEKPLSIGGPGIARHALDAGLVDELCLFFVPVLVGGGKQGLPPTNATLELTEERRFGGGVVFLRYRLT